ncbi:MAG: hydantoinase B/oxoprolinase family protein [Candidatus Tectomicrobia bacterium]|uniref:Hydantoinase B/oxoprolinase family protein n=1 Tax=Tectimicrobiota bacterium TaxID=2528274 RepID=A0A932HYD7_UNCTE|nr:hydantoinase B/oxoprolinase family protein [Candidatus Tectomicrobia bacterium]
MNVDPVVSEIVAGALRAIEEEVEELLGRVWRSPSLRDAGDFSAALYDRFGRALTGRVLGASPLPILSSCPIGDIRPGDVFLHNDPYLPPAGLGEAPDLRLTRPLFDGDRLIAFLQVRGRHDDLGGTHPGGAPAGSSEIYHEGLLLPPVRIAREEEPVADVRAILLRNSRRADVLADDMEAQLGALRVGALRLRDLVRRYGADHLTACFADLLRECELAFRRELLPRLPEGRWEAEAVVETDGFTGPHLLRLALERQGETLTVDLDGTGPQARGPINCPLEGEGRLFLARLLAPLLLHLAGDPARMEGISFNDGACRALDVRLPGPGSLVTPRFPAPAGLRVLTLGRLLSAFGEALFRASDGAAPAGFDNLRLWSLSGRDAGGAFHLFREALGAGMGASSRGDGASAVFPINGSVNLPVEWIEARYPLRVESAGLVRDSGGAGTHRGGLGVYREYRLLLEGSLSSGVSCHEGGPAGGCGGGPGGPCRLTLAEGKKRPQLLPPLASAHPFAPGNLLRVETPGGGGWGDPRKRDPEAVRLDVLRGFVSPEAAREVYGLDADSPRKPEQTRKAAASKGR